MSEYEYKSKEHLQQFLELVRLDDVFTVENFDDHFMLTEKLTGVHAYGNLRELYHYICGFMAGKRLHKNWILSDNELVECCRKIQECNEMFEKLRGKNDTAI